MFTRRNWESRLEHCGTIHAPDAEAALVLARETHVRHEEGVEFAVVPSEAFHVVADPSAIQRTGTLSLLDVPVAPDPDDTDARNA